MTSTPDIPRTRPLAAVILAAGKGTRMDSDLPKVLHPVADRPMLHWVIDACRRAGAAPIVLVVGHREDLVRDACSDMNDVVFVTQSPQNGTGHAVTVCSDALADIDGDVFVLAGDGPLIRVDVLHTLLATHQREQAAATLATAELDDPTGYGRIVRDEGGTFICIVEQRNATAEQQAITEVYPSYALFDVKALMETLGTLQADEVSGEYYLTAVPQAMVAEGKRVALVPGVDAQDILSINTREQLDAVDEVLRTRLRMEAVS
jgi:UDP-N-acetylglucosamine diphosphorylase/glucosamine-1-phosphate N-acetyltransferase